jgi:hypothetical protein
MFESTLDHTLLVGEFKSTREKGLKFAAFNVRLSTNGVPLDTVNGILEIKVFCDDEIISSGQLHIQFEQQAV